jgi:hypothetical protein
LTEVHYPPILASYPPILASYPPFSHFRHNCSGIGIPRLTFKYKKTTQMGCSLVAWRRPTLTGGIPQLPSALRSLTSVFGMGTGVTFSPSPPDCIKLRFVPSKLDNVEEEVNHIAFKFG